MNDSGEASSGLRRHQQGTPSDSRQPQDAGNVDRRWWETDESEKSPARPSANALDGSGKPAAPAFRPPPPPPPLNPDWFRAAAQGPGDALGPESFTAETKPFIPGLPADMAADGGTAVSSGAVPDRPATGVGHAAVPGSSSGQSDGTAQQAQAAAQASLDALTVQRLELELAAAQDEATALHEMLEDLPEIFERKFHQRLQSILEQQQRLLSDNQALREQLYMLAPGAPAVETRPSRLLLPATQPSLPPLQRRSPLGETLRRVLRLGRPDTAPGPMDPDRFS